MNSWFLAGFPALSACWRTRVQDSCRHCYCPRASCLLPLWQELLQSYSVCCWELSASWDFKLISQYIFTELGETVFKSKIISLVLVCTIWWRRRFDAHQEDEPQPHLQLSHKICICTTVCGYTCDPPFLTATLGLMKAFLLLGLAFTCWPDPDVGAH